MKNCTLVLIIMVACCAALAQTDSSKEAFKQMEGTWIPVDAELGGQPFPKEVLRMIKLVLKGDTYIAYVGDKADEGTCKVDATKKPATLDILGTKGPNKDKTYLAIYEQSGDTLRVCYDLTGKKRPTEFKTEKGTLQYFVVYKRQAP